MEPRHRVSRAAIDLIARFEGYRHRAVQLPDGRWMVGYGHTLTAREGAEVSQDDAEALLLYDLITVSHAVNECAFAPLTQNQFDALCSFAFNIGVDNFRRSGVLKRLNQGAPLQAACAMELWRKAEFQGERIVVDALVRRRASEKALFLTPPADWPVAPTPILRPLLDVEAEHPAAREAPIAAQLDGEDVRVLSLDEVPSPPVQPDEDQPSLVRAAAEAVTARLQTVVPSEPEPRSLRSLLDAIADPAADEPEPMPAGEAADSVASDESQPLAETPGEAEEPAPAEAPVAPEPAAANDVEGEARAKPVSQEAERERVLIDDTAPFEFTSPPVVPTPRAEGRGGTWSLVALATIGLAFFGGGVFWALTAIDAEGPVSPLIVGWLAGLAGVGLFSVAVFLLVQRIAAAGHRSDR